MPKTTYTDIDAVRYIKKYVDIVRKPNQHWEESKTMYYLMEGEKLVCKCHKTAVIPYYIEKLNEAIMFVFNIHKFDKPEVERMSINDLRELAGENKSVRYYGIKSILKNIKEKNFDFSESWVRLDYDTYPKGEIVLFYEFKTEIISEDLVWTIDEKTANVSRNKKGEMIVNYLNHTEIYNFSDFEDEVNTQEIETFHDVTTVKINLNDEQE